MTVCIYGQVNTINDNIETITNSNLNRASALMSQSSSILRGVRSTGPSTPKKDLTLRGGIRISAVEAVDAAMEVQDVEDHGKKGRKVGKDAEAGDETQASHTTAQANHTPIIIEEASTTPLYNLIDMPAWVLVASDNNELLGKESTIIPSEHKIDQCRQ